MILIAADHSIWRNSSASLARLSRHGDVNFIYPCVQIVGSRQSIVRRELKNKQRLYIEDMEVSVSQRFSSRVEWIASFSWRKSKLKINRFSWSWAPKTNEFVQRAPYCETALSEETLLWELFEQKLIKLSIFPLKKDFAERRISTRKK